MRQEQVGIPRIVYGLLVVALVPLLFVAASCGNSDSGGSKKSPTTTSRHSGASTTAHGGATTTSQKAPTTTRK